MGWVGRLTRSCLLLRRRPSPSLSRIYHQRIIFSAKKSNHHPQPTTHPKRTSDRCVRRTALPTKQRRCQRSPSALRAPGRLARDGHRSKSTGHATGRAQTVSVRWGLKCMGARFLAVVSHAILEAPPVGKRLRSFDLGLRPVSCIPAPCRIFLRKSNVSISMTRVRGFLCIHHNGPSTLNRSCPDSISSVHGGPSRWPPRLPLWVLNGTIWSAPFGASGCARPPQQMLAPSRIHAPARSTSAHPPPHTSTPPHLTPPQDLHPHRPPATPFSHESWTYRRGHGWALACLVGGRRSHDGALRDIVIRTSFCCPRRVTSHTILTHTLTPPIPQIVSVSALPFPNPAMVEWANQYCSTDVCQVGGAHVLGNAATGDVYWAGYCIGTFTTGDLPSLTCGSRVRTQPWNHAPDFWCP